LRGVQFIILAMLIGSFSVRGAMQLELTGNRSPISAFGIASINNEGVVFKTKPGKAEHNRYHWSDFSRNGLKSLLSHLSAERAFLQKDAQTKILYLDFIRAEILAQAPVAPPVQAPVAPPAQAPVAPPAQAPVAPPVIKPTKPINQAQIESAPNPAQNHQLAFKSATVQRDNATSQTKSDIDQDGQFNLVPGPIIPPPSAGKLSPINWLNPGGVVALLILAGLSAYAGYEIAVFRHRPVKTICALSALLPVIVPIVVLFLPDPAEAHSKALADANDRFLLEPTAPTGTVAGDCEISPEETYIDESGSNPVVRQGAEVAERYRCAEVSFSGQFFSEYFSRFYQTPPTTSQSLIIQTTETIYTVHHLSKLEPESLSVVYAQGQGFVEETVDYRLIEEVRVEENISNE